MVSLKATALSVDDVEATVSGSVRLADGIEMDLATGQRLVADAQALNGDINVLSHAHGDHLYTIPPERVVCSPLTAALANTRRHGESKISPTSHPRVELLESGHIAGATAAKVDDGERTYLYTGDISTRDRFFLSGFEPVPADVLIIESTYGKPEYVFPAQATVERRVVDWLNETNDRPVVVFAYSLGRAQEVQMLVERSDRSRLFTTDAIERLNTVIESHVDIQFGADRYTSDTSLGTGDVLVLPSQTRQFGWVQSLIETVNALTVGLSGWAVDSGFKYQGGYDETFPLSDHCDFKELMTVVESVDPEVVYTHHGFAEELANALVSELGYDARALKAYQSTLGDF